MVCGGCEAGWMSGGTPNPHPLIPGPCGALEAVMDFPTPMMERAPIAVLCHPHPLYGGTLQNKVVHTLARTCAALGLVSLRFNFRGVGGSAGAYGEGVGEIEDLHAVLTWVQAHWPGHPLWLGGFSFGAYVALQAAARWPLEQLITVAPPVNLFTLESSFRLEVPWLLVQGGQDEIVPSQAVMDWVASLEQPPRVILLPEAGHFFHGKLNELRDEILEALR